MGDKMETTEEKGKVLTKQAMYLIHTKAQPKPTAVNSGTDPPPAPSPLAEAVIDAVERAKMLREKREQEQRLKLKELQTQAALAQMQLEKRDEERRLRQQFMRAKDEERRQQVDERKRAIWEASVSRRQALLERDRERSERIERARQTRCTSRSAFAFGSSTPRTFDLQDMMGFNWAARRRLENEPFWQDFRDNTNSDNDDNVLRETSAEKKLRNEEKKETSAEKKLGNEEKKAASTSNVMIASTSQPAVPTSSTFNVLNGPERDENEKTQSSSTAFVGRRRTDLLPTTPSRLSGRAYSMTRLDKLPNQRPLHSASPSMHHLNRTTQWRSGETSPNSRPGSALSSTCSSVRRPATTRRPRPVSIAGTGVNTPKGTESQGLTTVPTVSRVNTLVPSSESVTRRPSTNTSRKPRPLSAHNLKTSGTAPISGYIEHKPPVKKREKTTSVKNQVNPLEVSQKLEKLQRKRSDLTETSGYPSKDKEYKVKEHKKTAEIAVETTDTHKRSSTPKPAEVKSKTRESSPEKKSPSRSEKREGSRSASPEKRDDYDAMSASMTARRITTEEEAKAALAERRRKAREELERQAELEKQRYLRRRLKAEAEAEEHRQREEEARLRQEEEEALELARLRRRDEEEKLRKAIEAQQRAEREEAERLVREEKERQARLREEEEKRKAAEEAETKRREEAEREEKERIARKQRVEAIMSRTRHKKQAIQAEEQKKLLEKSVSGMMQTSLAHTKDIGVETRNDPAELKLASAQTDNGNAVTGDLLNFDTSQSKVEAGLANESSTNDSTATTCSFAPNNGNCGDQDQTNIEDIAQDQTLPTKQVDVSPNANSNNTSVPVSNNGNIPLVIDSNVGHISADFIQTERLSEHNQKVPDMAKLMDDDFIAHNGHGTTRDNTLVSLQN